MAGRLSVVLILLASCIMGSLTIINLHFNVIPGKVLEPFDVELVARSTITCSSRCLETGYCNGFTYNSLTSECRLYLYTFSHVRNIISGITSVKLYLPMECPEDWTDDGVGMFYAISIFGFPITHHICRTSTLSNEVSSFLSLPSSNTAYRTSPDTAATTYLAYGIDIKRDRVDVRVEDGTLATAPPLGAGPSWVGEAGDCTSGRQQANFLIDLTGTEMRFDERTGMTIQISGSTPQITSSFKTNVIAYGQGYGGCSSIYFGHVEEGVRLISLVPLDST